jgi:hypothetical protein
LCRLWGWVGRLLARARGWWGLRVGGRRAAVTAWLLRLIRLVRSIRSVRLLPPGPPGLPRALVPSSTARGERWGPVDPDDPIGLVDPVGPVDSGWSRLARPAPPTTWTSVHARALAPRPLRARWKSAPPHARSDPPEAGCFSRLSRPAGTPASWPLSLDAPLGPGSPAAFLLDRPAGPAPPTHGGQYRSGGTGGGPVIPVGG